MQAGHDGLPAQVRKGFFDNVKAGEELYGPEVEQHLTCTHVGMRALLLQGSNEGVVPDGAGDPLGYLPKSLRERCKVTPASAHREGRGCRRQSDEREPVTGGGLDQYDTRAARGRTTAACYRAPSGEHTCRCPCELSALLSTPPLAGSA